MVEEGPDVRAIERRAYRSFHDDGLEDLLGGACLLGYGLLILTDWFMVFVPLAYTLHQLFSLARRKMTYPRVGYMRPSAVRQSDLRLLYFLVVFTAMWVLSSVGTMARMQVLSEGTVRMYVAMAAVPALIGVGLLTKAARWYVYSAMALLLSVATLMWRQGPMIGLAASGAVMLLWGIVLLWRFLLSHPVIAVQHDDTEVQQ